jgi:putative hydrolase of the HAD superfamily
LFTKGHPDEQLMKVDRSRLGRYFSHTALSGERCGGLWATGLPRPERDVTWMIGNSPKSDINPALEAGLNAVLVPHPHTWCWNIRSAGIR